MVFYSPVLIAVLYTIVFHCPPPSSDSRFIHLLMIRMISIVKIRASFSFFAVVHWVEYRKLLIPGLCITVLSSPYPRYPRDPILESHTDYGCRDLGAFPSLVHDPLIPPIGHHLRLSHHLSASSSLVNIDPPPLSSPTSFNHLPLLPPILFTDIPTASSYLFSLRRDLCQFPLGVLGWVGDVEHVFGDSAS